MTSARMVVAKLFELATLLSCFYCASVCSDVLAAEIWLAAIGGCLLHINLQLVLASTEHPFVAQVLAPTDAAAYITGLGSVG